MDFAPINVFVCKSRDLAATETRGSIHWNDVWTVQSILSVILTLTFQEKARQAHNCSRRAKQYIVIYRYEEEEPLRFVLIFFAGNVRAQTRVSGKERRKMSFSSFK